MRSQLLAHSLSIAFFEVFNAANWIGLTKEEHAQLVRWFLTQREKERVNALSHKLEQLPRTILELAHCIDDLDAANQDYVAELNKSLLFFEKRLRK